MSRNTASDKKSRQLVLARVVNAALGIVVVVALIAVGYGVVTAATTWSQKNHRSDAVDAARETVLALMSVSPSTVDEGFAKVAESSTGDFAEQFNKTSATIRETVMKYATQQTAEILRAAYSGGDSDSATILLAVDTTTVHQTPVDGEEDTAKDTEKKEESGDEKSNEPIVSHYRVRAEMALVEGVWMLAELEMAA